MPSSRGEVRASHDAGRRPGLDGEDRDRLRRSGQAAVRLDNQRLAREAGLAERRHELVEVALDDGSDIGVEQGGGTALVFPEHRGDLARERDVHARHLVLENVQRQALMGTVLVGEQEGDRDRLVAARLQRPRDRAQPRLVERNDRPARVIHALIELEDVALVRQQAGFLGHAVMVALEDAEPGNAPGRPHDGQRVAEAARRDHGGLCAREGEDGIARLRRGVDEPVRFGKHGPKRHAELGRGVVEPCHDAAAEIVSCGQGLADCCAPLLAIKYHDVGEGSADIDREREHAVASAFLVNSLKYKACRSSSGSHGATVYAFVAGRRPRLHEEALTRPRFPHFNGFTEILRAQLRKALTLS